MRDEEEDRSDEVAALSDPILWPASLVTASKALTFSEVDLPPPSVPADENLNQSLSNTRGREQDLLVDELLLLVPRREGASDHDAQNLHGPESREL